MASMNALPRTQAITARELMLAPDDIVVRRIRPTDTGEIERFYAALSNESRRTRFFAVGTGLSHRQSVSFCTPDHDHREGFVALRTVPGSSDERIVGHLCVEPVGPEAAEVAIAVADDWQHRGIGRQLLEAGVDWARAEGFSALVATTFAGNAPIHRLLMGLCLPTKTRMASSGTEDITIDLRLPIATT
jgi:GNAT superfamily N-acetyltransferase